MVAGGSLHLVRCLQVVPDFDPPFIVMDYAGVSGSAAVADAPPEEVLGLWKQIFFTLAALDGSSPPQVPFTT